MSTWDDRLPPSPPIAGVQPWIGAVPPTPPPEIRPRTVRRPSPGAGARHPGDGRIWLVMAAVAVALALVTAGCLIAATA